jgi:hypothetical protein
VNTRAFAFGPTCSLKWSARTGTRSAGISTVRPLSDFGDLNTTPWSTNAELVELMKNENKIWEKLQAITGTTGAVE